MIIRVFISIIEYSKQDLTITLNDLNDVLISEIILTHSSSMKLRFHCAEPYWLADLCGISLMML